MSPLAQIVFLTPRAALVALAFAVPLTALVMRERAGARVRTTRGLGSPARLGSLGRLLALVALAAVVGATAAQPAVRDVSSAPTRQDAELYLAFDVSRSMLATTAPGGVPRLERARSLGLGVRARLDDVPTGVATLTNRMMPLLFPTGDDRSVTAVIEHSLRIMQPRPVVYSTARESSLAALGLAADRSYFDPSARKRALVVFTDMDSDSFSIAGTLRVLRQHRIEPFVVRTARPGERIFDAKGRPYDYVSVSTVSVAGLREAHWQAFEENEPRRLVAAIRSYLGDGPTAGSGLVEAQRSLAPLTALLAFAIGGALLVPALRAGFLARA